MSQSGLGDRIRELYRDKYKGGVFSALRSGEEEERLAEEFKQMGTLEMGATYLAETGQETVEQLGRELTYGGAAIGAMAGDAMQRVDPRGGFTGQIGGAISESLPSMEEIGGMRLVEQAQRDPSVFDDAYISPRDLGGVAGSVALNVATIASGGMAAPVTVPALFAQTVGGIVGSYAETIAATDVEYDPAVAAGLTAIAVLETVGGVGTGIKLPMALARKAGGKEIARALAEGSREARKAGSRAGARRFLSIAKDYGIAAGAEGFEEVGEEALESLATIMYEPEFDELRERIASGAIDAKDLKDMYDMSFEGGLKTFLLGGAGGSVGFGAAQLSQRDKVRQQREKAIAAAEKERIALEVTTGEIAPDGPRADEVAAEDVTPEDVPASEPGEATFADFDSDEFMDRLVAEDPEAVERILMTPTGRPRKGGRSKAVWEGVLPAGMKTNQPQREKLFGRLKQARDRARAAEVAGDVGGVGTTTVTVGDAEVVVPPVEDVAVEDTLSPAEEELADLRREEERLTQELVEAQSFDPEGFEDNPEYQEASSRLYEVQQEIEQRQEKALDEADPDAYDPEWSTAAPVTQKNVDASTLEEEPGTQMGSMPGGIATQASTGRRFYVKRYENREQVRNEAVANRLYAAGGVNVPNTGLLREGDAVVGVASEMVPGLTQGVAPDAADGLIMDAWLANWDVVGLENDNLLVDTEGRSIRIDQGGALTTRSRGEPKGEAFGNTVGEIETLPAMNEALSGASPAQLRRGFQNLEAISEQDIKRIVQENSTGDTASDNRLIATLIKRRRDLLSRRDEIIGSADAEFSTTAAALEIDALNASRPETFAPLTPEQEANLTDGERQIAENARKRLGKEVVFVTQTAGTRRNGFILNRNSNRIYLVVPSDTRGNIAKVASRRGISEREVQEAYEAVLLQTLLHENYHLHEGVDGSELTDEQKASRAAVHSVLSHAANVRFNNRIMALVDMRESGVIDDETFARELRAEAATDLVTLGQTGVEAMFLDRGLLRNSMARLRMLANRIGGPKEVKAISRIVRNMTRDGQPIVTSPEVVGETVEMSTSYPSPSERPGYDPEAGYAPNSEVPALAFRNVTAADIQAGHQKNSRQGYLTPFETDELQAEIDKGDAIARMSPDGNSGYVLKKTAIGWDIGGVFNNEGGVKGAGRAALIDGLSLGGNTLDCFDGYLPLLYGNFAFVATHRMKFNPKFAPPAWKIESDGDPDVVIMTFTGATNEKQALVDLAGYYAENPEAKRKQVGELVEDWPSDASRTSSPFVREVRQEASRLDDATNEIVRRVLNPEFSTPGREVLRSHIPYVDFARVVANPTSESVLQLFVDYRAFSTFKAAPKKGEITAEQVAREMESLGMAPDEGIAQHVAKHYKEAISVAPSSTLRGDSEVFGPRGRVETELSNIFKDNPSPTADQLSTVKGAPVPRDAKNGVVVVKHTPAGKGDREKMAATFVRNAEEWLKGSGTNYVVTDNDAEVERLLKDHDTVVVSSPSVTALHMKPTVIDRHKAPRDYAEFVEAAREAVALGHHNWYRDFGREFGELFGREALVEAAFVFGVTSAQSPVEVNLADTLFVMKAVREHRRLGKPWNVEAVAASIFNVRRRTKHTKTGTALPFVKDNMAKLMARFYVNGLEDAETSIKTRTYSGNIVAAGLNNFYPHSVQDRHMAAMFGFNPGSVDPISGKFKTDKLLKGDYENRYASYLTQRLTMEEGLVGLTPSQMQAALWFFIKSGRSVYADVEVKENAGAIKAFEDANPDVTMGTLSSAMKFAEYEVSDLLAEIDLDPTPIEVGNNVPGFTMHKFGSTDYSAGSAEARRLSEIMAAEGARVTLSGYPNIEAPGILVPAMPMHDSVMDELHQNIISAVTETDGSVRLLNDMGTPHMPLMGFSGAMNGDQYQGLHIIPLVGSITDPAAARVIGSIVGLGTMQPRMATIQNTPGGDSLTLRVSRADGEAIRDRDADRMNKSLGVFHKGHGDVIQSVGPDAKFIEVTITPREGSSVDNDVVAAKYEQVSKEIANATGVEVRAEAFRSEVEITEASQYAGVISESGLSAGQPSDLLGRVLSEVSTPVLSVLESNGFGFNRDRFIEGTGIERGVVEASIPMVEFSTPADMVGIMPLADQDALRTDPNIPVVSPETNSMGEMAAAELRWWSSLEQDDRQMLGAWVASAGFQGDGRTYSGISDKLRSQFYAAQPSFNGLFWTASRIVGGINNGTMSADKEVIRTMLGSQLDTRMNQEGAREINEAVGRGIAAGLASVYTRQNQDDFGFMFPELLFDVHGNWLGNPVLYGTAKANGLQPMLKHGLDGLLGVYIAVPPEMTEEVINDYSPRLVFTKGEDVFVQIAHVGSGLSTTDLLPSGEFAQNITTANIVDSLGATEVIPHTLRSAMAREITREVTPLLDQFHENMKRFTPVYNRLVRALAKAPKLEGKVYRGHFVRRGDFLSRFKEGDVFRIDTPASMSTSPKSARGFMGDNADGDINDAKQMAKLAVAGTPVAQWPDYIRGISSRDVSDRFGASLDDMAILFEIESKTGRLAHTPGMTGERGDAELVSGVQRRARGYQMIEDDVSESREDNTLGVQLRRADEAADFRGQMANVAEILQEQGHLTAEEAAEIGSIEEYTESPSGISVGEFEIAAMPGTAYQIMRVDPVSNLITLRELDPDPDRDSSLPVFAEFSTPPPATPAPTEPDVSTETANSIMWHRDKGRRKRAAMYFRRSVQDRFVDLDYLQRDIAEAYGMPLDISEDPIAKIRSMPGEVAHRAERFSKRVVEPLAMAIARSGLTQAEMGEYCCAIHALDVNRELGAATPAVAGGAIDSGLSDDEAKAIISRMENRTDIDINEVNSLQQRVVGIGRQNLRKAKNAGLISQKQFDDMNEVYPNYVPFWNAFDPSIDSSTHGAEQFTVPTEIFKARTGRTANSLKGNNAFFQDRLAALADQRYRIIRKGLNNEVLKRMLKLATKTGGNLLKVYKPGITTVVDKDGTHRAVPDSSWMRDPTVFRVMINGNPVLLQVAHPELASAMRKSSIDPGRAMRVIMRPFQMYSSVFRYFTTQFGNPDFTFTNPARDIQTGAASIAGENTRLSAYKNGKAKQLGVVDRLRIIVRSGIQLPNSWGAVLGIGTEAARRDYAKYRALGGRQGIFKGQDPMEARRMLREAAMSATPVTGVESGYYKGKRVVRGTVGTIAKVWEAVNMMFDDGIRFAAYRQLVREGVHPEKAVETARDLTVDFSRMGTAGPVVNTLYVYSNATIQGSTKTMRLLKSKTGKTIIGAYIMAGVMSELWNDDEEDRDGNLRDDWDQIPDYQRDADMHIRLPEGFGSDEDAAGYLKIPVAYGLAVPFVAGRRLVRMIKGKDTIGEGSMAMLNAAISQFVPGGFGQPLSAEDPQGAVISTVKALSPDIFDPALGLMTNTDWLGHSIYNEPFPTDQLKNRSAMGRDTTAEYWKDAAGMVNLMTGGDEVLPGAVSVQPEVIPFLLNAVFGGTAKSGGRFMDMLEQGMHDDWIRKHYPDEADTLIMDRGYDKIPVIRRFFSTTNQPYDDRTAYYEYKKIGDKADQAIREYDERGEYDKAQAMEDASAPALAIRDMTKQVTELRKEMRDTKAAMQAEGIDEMEIKVEMRRFAADIRQMQSEIAVAYREEERYAEAEAGSN